MPLACVCDQRARYESRDGIATTGRAYDVDAARPLSKNSRGNLTWTTGTGFCDYTVGVCS